MENLSYSLSKQLFEKGIFIATRYYSEKNSNTIYIKDRKQKKYAKTYLARPLIFEAADWFFKNYGIIFKTNAISSDIVIYM